MKDTIEIRDRVSWRLTPPGSVQRWAGPRKFGHVIEAGDTQVRVEGDDDKTQQWIDSRLITKEVG